MSARKRTCKAPKGAGYDFWSRRPPNSGVQGYGRDAKKRTHSLERIQGKQQAKETEE